MQVSGPAASGVGAAVPRLVWGREDDFQVFERGGLRGDDIILR